MAGPSRLMRVTVGEGKASGFDESGGESSLVEATTQIVLEKGNDYCDDLLPPLPGKVF